MKYKVIIYVICILAFLVLQSTFAMSIELFGVRPNLLIVFIISVALLRGRVEGAYVGFFTGLGQDIFTGKILGFYALLGLYLGLLIGSINKRLYRENFLVIIFFTFISSILYETIVFIFGVYLFTKDSYFKALGEVILPEAAYNVIASIFIYILVIKLNDKINETDKRIRKY